MFSEAMVVRPCACGWVATYLSDPGPSLLAHYRTDRHRRSAWGRAVDQAQPERPTAGPYSVDVSGDAPCASTAPAGKP